MLAFEDPRVPTFQRRIAELEDLVAEYERQRNEKPKELRQTVIAPEALITYRDVFKVSPSCARILYLLHTTEPGAFVLHTSLYGCLTTRAKRWDNRNSVFPVLKVYVCELRKILGGLGAIECMTKYGYRLTDAGRAAVDEIMERTT